MYKLAVFDLDGTLLNTLEDIATSANRALRLCGFPMHPEKSYRHFLGMGMRRLVEDALPAEVRGDTETVDKVMKIHRNYYTDHYMDATKPYDGMVEALTRIKEAGVTSVVLSNKPHDLTVLQAKLYFPGLFQGAFGQREDVPIKPDPTALEQIIACFDVPKDQVVYIGDTSVDIHTGRGAGVDTVAVLWGFRDEHELVPERPVHFAAKPLDLLKIIIDKDE